MSLADRARQSVALVLIAHLSACDRTTGSESAAATFTTTISGAINEVFHVGDPVVLPDTSTFPVTNTFALTGHGAPGYFSIFAARARGTEQDALTLSVAQLNGPGEYAAEGFFRYGSAPNGAVYALEGQVRITRVTSSRLTGEFTAIGAPSSIPISASPDSIQLTDGSFDVALTSSAAALKLP